MNINKNNYEEFFIDYYDGSLSAEQVAELFLFLDSNPELQTEFEGFSNITLDKTDFEFPFKEELKKELINDSNFSHYMIASVEGDLSSDEMALLDAYVKNNPGKSNDLKLFQASILSAGTESYPGKNELKQPVPLQFNFSNYGKYAIAAILLMLFIASAYLLFFKSSQQSSTEFAEGTTPPSKDSNSIEVKDSIVQNTQIIPVNRKNEMPDLHTANRNQSHFAQNNVVNSNSNPLPSHRKVKNKSLLEVDMQNDRMQIAFMETIPGKQLSLLNNEPLIAQYQAMVSDDKIATASNERYLTLWEALRHTTDRKLQKLTSNNQEVLALADDNSTPVISVKDLLQRGIEKVSNDKVSIKNENDPGNDFSRFSFSLGNFKFEKDRVK